MKYILTLTTFLLLTLPASTPGADFTPTNTQAVGEHPLAPAEAVTRLKLPEGFRVTLAAAEPDARQPIAFDDRGRLWVAERYSNNGSKNAASGKPRHDIATYSSNLQKVFAKLKALTDAKIIFALTTPVDEQRQAESKGYGRIVRRSADIATYNKIASEVATAAGVSINDVNALAERVGAGDILRKSDGIHLSEFGQLVIGRQVASAIEDALNDAPRMPLPDEQGFEPIVNGATLEGWDGKPGAWEVHDGAIWCTGRSSEKNWLIWRDGQPADFVLRLEFRWDKGNSGVQVRSDDQGDWMVSGYQVEVAQQAKMGLWHHSLLPNDHAKKEARHLMSTAGQSIVLAADGSKTVTQNQPATMIQTSFTEHAWNTLEITARGDTLTQKINSVVFSTVTDRDKEMSRRKGVIALQDHGKGCKVAFRNIRLMTLKQDDSGTQ